MTFDEQVEKVLEWYHEAPESEQLFFRNLPEDKLIQLHHTTGRDIRNRLKLWDAPWDEEVVGGVDVSDNHPDAISMRIIKAVWSRVQ